MTLTFAAVNLQNGNRLKNAQRAYDPERAMLTAIPRE
jgi:hypothetical protein